MSFSDRTLKQAYRKFNHDYWNGELPDDTDVFWAPTTSDCVAMTDRDDEGCFTIQMSPSISEFTHFWKLILIHEMVHVAMWKRERALHGATFKKELLRVLSLGAIRYV